MSEEPSALHLGPSALHSWSKVNDALSRIKGRCFSDWLLTTYVKGFQYQHLFNQQKWHQLINAPQTY